jgi:hypothetical protein
MKKHSESHDLLDDKLSEFTDLLLSSGDEIKVKKMVGDDDLLGLQRVAIRMKAAAKMARPSSAASARVRARLLKEWKQQIEQPKSSNFFKIFFQSLSLPRLAVAGGLVVLLLLSVLTFIIPVSPPLTGAAVIKLQAWTPLFILFGIILIIALFWFDRRN